ncbi:MULTISPECIES: TetR/AcrR family transcriptional regulator [Pseudomonas]|jgi:Transcriptional regulator|uniref:TetR family transcriptional regulator n=1 Tax=Pseudomonas coronafaciens pv. porri TaxID=83964 RepID=A0ABR5JT54_9PSED|nr:TetR/AcrR family transcriptional regulator [Pseudomonas coronafaciens]AZP73266.1 TetR/AcrR family transcriptional regulator [Pseudomonas poae]KOP60689.1 TetR family transcriptional regulator [Pseudomonas coronafaciens pv. porri]
MSITTKAALLSYAETQMRSKGYSAFSYADLAAKVGIRKASIHHHFPTKECLGAELINDYINRFNETLASIETMHPEPLKRLQAFSQLFVMSANEGLLPLCGALAAEMAALPLSLQGLTRDFFNAQLDWLQSTLSQAVRQHNWSLETPVENFAFMLLSSLEGASLIDWTLGRTTDPLAGFNHLLEMAAMRSSFLCAG